MLKQLTNKARQLTLRDWLALVEAWWMLFFFHLGLGWMSYERLMSMSPPNIRKKYDSQHGLIIAQNVQRLVGLASRLHLIQMTCLVKSLTLNKMLYKRNIPAQVKIGAQKIGNTMYAHAWVEINRSPIGENEDVPEKFHVLESNINFNHHQFI